MKSQEIEPETSSSETLFAEAREFARQLLEEREKNALLPRSEDPFFLDDEVWEGPVPADLVERNDDYLAETDDSLFRDYKVYEGPAPSDLSERHDDYLYGDKS